MNGRGAGHDAVTSGRAKRGACHPAPGTAIPSLLASAPMTLNRLAALLTLGIAAASLVAFLATGSVTVAMGLLVAPVPWLLATLGDRGDWTPGEILRQSHDGPLADDLDRTLRGPLATPLSQDDDLFLPDCPPLRTGAFDAPAAQPTSPPTSTPLR